ncbi:MAG: right-handed parallel beta-helix repeat-containing protein [Bacteroidales bacterium]
MKNLLILSLTIILSVSLFNCKNDEPVNEIYVNSKTGNDANPGTAKRPLKSITEVNTRIQAKPVTLLFAGDQVYEGTLLINNINGTASIPLVIGSYGGGRAEIDGGKNEAIRIENCRFLRVENFYLTGDGRKDGNGTNGLQLKDCHDCVVENIIAEGFQKSGVDLNDCRNIQVLKVLALYNGFCGINVMGSDKKLSGSILIRDCKAENNPGDPTMLDNHSGNGILVGVSDSVVIDHSSATDNGWDMPRQGNGPVGIWTWQSDHIIIQYCISYRNKTSKGGKDGGGFDLDGGVTNSVIQYCLSYENQGAGYGLFQYPGASDWFNNVIRYCVSINDAQITEGSGSFFIWNGSEESSRLKGCYIYNNVAYNTLAPVISFENASRHENFNFSNNIFLGSGQMISGTNTGSSFVGNVWWSPVAGMKLMKYVSLEDWVRASGQEMLKGKIVGLQVDPGLTGPSLTELADPYRLNELTGYTLKPGSPIRNKGIDLRGLSGFEPPSRDFFGNPVPEGEFPEPGIHEIK